MATVLITGASRGLGLELARQYAALGWDVIATCRTPAEAVALQQLAEVEPRVCVAALDVNDHGAIDRLAADLRGMAIDVLINNAGIGSRDTALGTLDYARWDDVLATNCIGPVKVLEAFLEHVAASGQKKIVSISSSLGSIGTARRGGSYFYRTSKAALNMAMRAIANDVAERGIIIGILSPGVVDTDFTKGARMPKISPAESASGLIGIIRDLTPEKSGTFIRYNGDNVAW